MGKVPSYGPLDAIAEKIVDLLGFYIQHISDSNLPILIKTTYYFLYLLHR